jgi:hypothetical protein
MTRDEHAPIPAPWVLIDDHTVAQAADLIGRLTSWLQSADPAAAASCARALSLGEIDDPITIASWADAIAARLRHRADDSAIQDR